MRPHTTLQELLWMVSSYLQLIDSRYDLDEEGKSSLSSPWMGLSECGR